MAATDPKEGMASVWEKTSEEVFECQNQEENDINKANYGDITQKEDESGKTNGNNDNPRSTESYSQVAASNVFTANVNKRTPSRPKTARVKVEKEHDIVEFITTITRIIGMPNISRVNLANKNLYHIGFTNQQALEKFTSEGFFFLGDLINPEKYDSKFKLITLRDVPVEIEDKMLKAEMSKFGKVLNITHLKHSEEEIKWLDSGNYKIKIMMNKEIPNYVRIGSNYILVTYNGVKKLCGICKKEGHLARACTLRKHNSETEFEETRGENQELEHTNEYQNHSNEESRTSEKTNRPKIENETKQPNTNSPLLENKVAPIESTKKFIPSQKSSEKGKKSNNLSQPGRHEERDPPKTKEAPERMSKAKTQERRPREEKIEGKTNYSHLWEKAIKDNNAGEKKIEGKSTASIQNERERQNKAKTEPDQDTDESSTEESKSDYSSSNDEGHIIDESEYSKWKSKMKKHFQNQDLDPTVLDKVLNSNELSGEWIFDEDMSTLGKRILKLYKKTLKEVAHNPVRSTASARKKPTSGT